MKHKHAELIKAWADGAKIEQLFGTSWNEVLSPGWIRDAEYRIKPQPKEIVELPKIVKHWLNLGIDRETIERAVVDALDKQFPPQPQEPQYLYVYQHETEGLILGYAPHAALNMWKTKIVGKIKLEQDDAN